MGQETEGRVPQEALNAATRVIVAWGDEDPHRYPLPPEATTEAALEAAYPLIHRAVCQEIAEALRVEAREQRQVNRTTGRVIASAAEFVESYAATTEES